MWTWMFGGWRSGGYVAVSTVVIYLTVVVGIRIGQRRTLAELTAYDFAVAVATGGIIARTATSRSPSYVQGAVAVVSLLVAHHTLSWARRRYAIVRAITDRPPLVVMHDGVIDEAALKRARLTRADVDAALREHGFDDRAEVRLLVLEARGALSVVAQRHLPARERRAVTES